MLKTKVQSDDSKSESMLDGDGFIISDSSNKMSSYAESFPKFSAESKDNIAESLGKLVIEDSYVLSAILCYALLQYRKLEFYIFMIECVEIKIVKL